MVDLRNSTSGASIASAVAGFGRYGTRIAFAPDTGAGNGKTEAKENDKKDAAKPDAAKKDGDDNPEPDKLDKLMGMMDGFKSMMDGFGGRLDAVEKTRSDGAKKDEMSMPSKEEREVSKRQSGDETVQERERDKQGVGDSKKDAAKKDGAKKDEDADEIERKKRESAKDDAAKADAARTDGDARYAALQREIDALKARPQARQFTDADHNAMVAAQTRADSVFGLFGKRAPIPVLGETPLAYRLRMMHDLKPNSDVKVDLVKVASADPDAVAYFEDKIYADSIAAANNPTDLEDGELRRIVTKDDMGRTFIDFKGRHTYAKRLSPPAQRLSGFRVSPKAA